MAGSADLESFSGKARLFPLPNLVFFPHVMQPLHIFEPRYRQMVEDALDDDRLLAMVLPQPGWESDFGGAPPIHTVACLGRIVGEQRLEDGRFNLLLRGLARMRIVREINTKKLYRIARCEVLHDNPIANELSAMHWRQMLIEKAPAWFPKESETVAQFKKLLHSDIALGTLGDIITFALPLDAEFKQVLLEEPNVEVRLRTLHDFLEARKAIDETAPRRFPPDFSAN